MTLGESSPLILTEIVGLLQGLVKQAKCLIHCTVDYLELEEPSELINLIVLAVFVLVY